MKCPTEIIYSYIIAHARHFFFEFHDTILSWKAHVRDCLIEFQRESLQYTGAETRENGTWCQSSSP